MAKERLLKNTAIYFVGMMATRFLNLLMQPLYTSAIPTQGMGYYKFVYSLLSVAVPGLLFMVWDVYLRFALDCKEEEERRRVTSTALLSSGALMVVYLVVFVVVGNALRVDYTWEISLVALVWPLSYLWQSGLRSRGENKVYAIAGTVSTAVNIIISLLFILVFKLPVLSLYLSLAGSFLTTFLIAEPKVRLLSQVKLRLFDWGLLKRMLSFGAPLVVNSVAFYFINGVSSFVIIARLGKVAGNDANALFGTASTFSMFIATVAQIFFLAWQEEAFREAANEKLHGYMSKVLSHYTAVLFAGVCFGLPILKLIYPVLIRGAYTPSWVYVPAVILTAVYSALSSFAGTAFSAKMKTGVVMVTTIVGGTVSVLLSWFGMGLFGIQAVAAAGGIGFLLTFLLRIYFSRRAVKIEVNWPRFLLLNAAAAVVTYAYFQQQVYVQLLASAAGLVLFLALNRELILSVGRTVFSRLRSRG